MGLGLSSSAPPPHHHHAHKREGGGGRRDAAGRGGTGITHTHTHTPRALSTPACCSIMEQERHPATTASDVFSFSMCMYEMLTWMVPWAHIGNDFGVRKGGLPPVNRLRHAARHSSLAGSGYSNAVSWKNLICPPCSLRPCCTNPTIAC